LDNRFNGKKLKAFREQKAWNQKDLAHELNLNLNYTDERITDRDIRRWENEGVKPRSEVLLGLAMVLECETEDFFEPILSEEKLIQNKNASYELLEKDLCSFKSFIKERTRDFEGRQFVFDVIDNFIKHNECGYFFVLGDPGIGKSAVAAKLVNERDYIHHFNVRAEGINRAETFLRNICAQLIIRFELPYESLAHDVGADGKFLSKLLEEVGRKLSGKESLVIVVDALDEVDESSGRPGANLLFLPKNLPSGIFFVITARPQSYQLQIECIQDKFEIQHDKDNNLNDIEKYLEKRVKLEGIQSYNKKQKLSNQDFVSIMKGKSDGNFMYLRYVLPEIEKGAYKNIDFENIPVGLQNYYEDHWRRMGMMTKPLPELKIQIIYILSELHKPISTELLADCCRQNEVQVQEIVDEWTQFLHRKVIDHKVRYSLYHASFRDFLNRKEIVKAAGIDIRDINALISEWLSDGLYDE